MVGLRQYADRRILVRREMESFGRISSEGFVAAEPEVLFVLTLVGLARLLRPYLGRALARPDSTLGLTGRENEVLAWVAAGRTNAQIAEILSIAPGTVKKHLEHIYEKLGVSSRTDAAVTAIGLVIASRPRPSRPRSVLLIA
jgi:DNA-binding CsgD family transcriptional regulator